MKIPSYLRTKDEREAYRAGYDCAVNGPSTTNCNFSIFSTRLMTSSWELGKRHGDAIKAKPEVVQSALSTRQRT